MKFAISSDDAKAAIKKALGDLSGVEIWNNQVLVAVFIRPEKTAGGIILADTTGGRRDEDKWQGKVGLIVKLGPDALKDEAGKWFKSVEAEQDDWIFFRSSDGWAITINGYLCRILDDTSIRGKVDHPERVF